MSSSVDPPPLPAAYDEEESSSVELTPEGQLKSRSVKIGPIFSTDLKIILAIGYFFTLVLITFACLTGNKTLLAPDWVTSALEYASWGIGGLQLLSLGFLLRYYCRTKQELEHRARISLSIDDPISPPAVPPRPTPTPPIPQEEWNTRLATEQKQGKNYYNLDQPGKPCALSGISPLPQLPLFGSYKHDSFSAGHKMSVQLPSSQLKAFPKKLQKWFGNEGLADHAECYFIVFDNTVGFDRDDLQRSIPFHTQALFDYNMEQPTQISTEAQAQGVTPYYKNGIKCGIEVPVKMALFKPSGISTFKEGSIPQNQPSQFKLILHGVPNKTPQFSPKNPEFSITQGAPVASGYFGATFRGRAVAIHAIFLNDSSFGQGEKLAQALKTQHVDAFLSSLDQSKFSMHQEVRKTFTHPSQLQL